MNFFLTLLSLIVGNSDLQKMAARPVAQELANVLPDATESEIADFLDLVAADLRAVHGGPTPVSN